MSKFALQSPVIDLVALDREDRPILGVEVKARRDANPATLDWLRTFATRNEPTDAVIPYWMVVDLDQIWILRHDVGEELTFQVRFPTSDILKIYDSSFGQKRIFEDYLIALVNAWLHDLAYQWKSAPPPGWQELTQLGLIAILQESETYREVSLAPRDLVPRNQLFDESFTGP